MADLKWEKPSDQALSSVIITVDGAVADDPDKHVSLLGQSMKNSYDPMRARKDSGKNARVVLVDKAGLGNRSDKVMANRAHEAIKGKSRNRTPGDMGTSSSRGDSGTWDKADNIEDAIKDKVGEVSEGTKKAEKGTKSGTGSSFVRKVDAIYAKRSHRQITSWKGTIWFALIFFQFIGAVLSLALLYPSKPASGDWTDFGPRVTMRTENVTNAVFLAISRITAYMMYPCVILAFLAKAHNLRTWFWKTQCRLYLPFFERLHDVHVRAGWLCFLLTWTHAVFHVWRFARLECMEHLYKHQTGLTGMIGTFCVTVVVLPFGLRRLRKGIKYEVRKWFHVVGGLGFGLSGALHAPATNVIVIYGCVVFIYLMDWLTANFLKVWEVEICHFTRLQDSVVLHWEDPVGYNHAQHGYVNICIPFISKYEWHAISIYPCAHVENSSSLCIARAGDWSKKLHADTIYKTSRPIWIQGPFLTPFSASVDYDNAICVSSGSGVSASLAAIQSLKKHRRVSFIWLCRDASMVEYYLNTYEFDSDAYTLIFYTGKQKITVPHKLPAFVLIFETRPDLRNIVCMIIKSIESQDCLPEDLVIESELNEKDMNAASDHLADITGLEEPLEMLHKLLGRSLKNYKPEELIMMLDDARDDMPVKEFEYVLFQICPEATFSAQAIAKLAEHFEDSSKSMDGYVSKERLIEYVEQTLQEYCTSGSRGIGPHAAQATHTHSLHTDKEARGKFAGKGADGEQALKNYMAEMDEEKLSGRLKRWAVLYCGGSLPVSEALMKVCADFDIKYDQEKFDW